MPTKRLLIPDDILRPLQPGEDKHLRLLQYTNATTQENFEAFLTHHAFIYILSGVKEIKVAQHKVNIQSGELFLIPRGEYVMSEYITGEFGFRSIMLFFSKKVARTLIEQLNGARSIPLSHTPDIKKEAIKIIPHNRDINALFSSLEAYSKNQNPFTYELIKLKFTELIYLLLDSPYQKLILSFLLDAARDENTSISSILDSHLYSSATLNELAILSARSLSSFKREFAQQYGEPPRTWIRKKKLERAAFLLETSEDSIERIAEISGFVSNTHFNRVFKEYYHSTPTEYKTKQIRN